METKELTQKELMDWLKGLKENDESFGIIDYSIDATDKKVYRTPSFIKVKNGLFSITDAHLIYLLRSGFINDRSYSNEAIAKFLNKDIGYVNKAFNAVRPKIDARYQEDEFKNHLISDMHAALKEELERQIDGDFTLTESIIISLMRSPEAMSNYVNYIIRLSELLQLGEGDIIGLEERYKKHLMDKIQTVPSSSKK